MADERRPETADRKPTPGEIIARTIRLRNRPLFVQEKVLAGAVQKPPAASAELLRDINAEREREIAEQEALKERIKEMVLSSPSVKNLRAVYLDGVPFNVARMKPREFDRFDRQHPGFGISAPWDFEFMQGYLIDLFGQTDWRCEHGKLWHEECQLCEAGLPASGLSDVTAKERNAALAKWGLSAWKGKGRASLPRASADSRNEDAGTENAHRNRNFGRSRGNGPDSFQARGEDRGLPGGGQDSSRADPDYGGRKAGLPRGAGAPLTDCEVPSPQGDSRRLPPDGERSLQSVDECERQSEEVRARKYERIKEDSTEGEVQRIAEDAAQEINEVERTVIDGQKRPKRV